MATDPRQHLGRTGEQLAVDHLERLGYTILERNFRTRYGELDIIAFDGADTIAFVEVKTRRAVAGTVTPLESVHWRKRTQIRRMAAVWLAQGTDHPYAGTLRFDAIGIVLDRHGQLLDLAHLEQAF